MDNDTTYQVRQYRDGYGKGSQVASGIKTLEEATEIAFRLTKLQDEWGGNYDFTILPE